MDVLVNNAGYGSLGALEKVSDEEIRRQFEVNFFGLLNVTRAVCFLTYASRGAVTSSTSRLSGGFIGVPSFGIYNGTNFAVEGVLEALAREVGHLGFESPSSSLVRCVPTERGARWPRRMRSRTTRRQLGRHASTIANENGNQQGDPRLAARAIITAVDAAEPPLRLVLGADALEGVQPEAFLGKGGGR